MLPSTNCNIASVDAPAIRHLMDSQYFDYFCNMIELPVIPSSQQQQQRKPDWLRVKLPVGREYAHVRGLVDEHKLHTICESGNCPNLYDIG
jgi:hypothetical protein